MANNKPKSLDELNSLYAKSMAAQNAIKKSGSAIADSDKNPKGYDLSAYAEDILTPKEKTPQQKASEELSDALSDFMKTFGESSAAAAEKPQVRQPLPITKTVKPSASQKAKADKAPEQTKATAEKAKSSSVEAPKAKKEKPDLMRNPEKSDLIDDYMKIMNDEDDDVAFLKGVMKKKKKNKKDKHHGSPLFEEEKSEQTAEDDGLFEQQEGIVTPSNEAEPDKQDEQEEFEAFYENEEDSTEPPEEDVQEEAAPVKKKKKNVFLQVILMFILLAVLICAVGMSLLKVVVGVDSGNAFIDKYYVFTADDTYENAKVNEGDLVITENKMPAENDAFAYADSQSEEIIYALKGTQISDEMFMAHSENQVELINESSVRGTVIRTIPGLGSAVSIIMDNFIIVISALVAVALILILVLALAFRSKSNYDIDDSEEEHPDNEEDVEAAEELTAEAEDDYESDHSDTEEASDEEQEDLFSTID